MPRLTQSQMKYLHVIYKAIDDKRFIRSVDVARELCVTKASVSRMMKLFAEMELITVHPSGNIELTPTGKNEGAAIHLRFLDLYPFFAYYLELGEPEAAESAYLFLSAFSEHCVDTLLIKGWK